MLLAQCCGTSQFQEKFFKYGKRDDIQDRNKKDGTDGPCLDAVEGGHAEVAGELGGIVFELSDQLGDGEFDEGDAVEHLAEADVDEDERELEGIGEGFKKVEDGLVESK